MFHDARLKAKADLFRKNLGVKIREAREKKGMTPEAAAALAGITENNLLRIEDGRYGAKIDLLFCIALALERKIDMIEISPSIQPSANDKTP